MNEIRVPLRHARRFFIDGEWVQPSSEAMIDVIDSATEQLFFSVAEAKAGIGSWLSFYNEERQHQSLGYRTPREAYQAECRWICGRSATPTGGAFAHIPTGTTATHRIDVDKGEDRNDVMTVAPAAIGAGTEIGRATP